MTHDQVHAALSALGCDDDTCAAICGWAARGLAACETNLPGQPGLTLLSSGWTLYHTVTRHGESYAAELAVYPPAHRCGPDCQRG